MKEIVIGQLKDGSVRVTVKLEGCRFAEIHYENNERIYCQEFLKFRDANGRTKHFCSGTPYYW